MNFFDHKNLGNHLLQLCPKVVKHHVYVVRHQRVNDAYRNPRCVLWASHKNTHKHMYKRVYCIHVELLGAFVQSRNATITFVTSVRLPPHVPERLPLYGFTWDFILGQFLKICSENQNLVTIGQKYWVRNMKTLTRLLLSATINHHKSSLFDRNFTRMSVRPSVRTYQRGSHWTDFREI